MKSYLHYIGFIGPIILIYATYLYLFYFNIYKKLLFTIMILFNSFINISLKKIIKQPRPKDQKPFIPFSGKYNDYGMPSGHAQMSAFVLVFFFMNATQYKIPISLIYLTISILTLYQRYRYKAHTFQQICVGFLIGAIWGWISSFY
jgi:membrane-associated phospholipid phosphatase